MVRDNKKPNAAQYNTSIILIMFNGIFTHTGKSLILSKGIIRKGAKLLISARLEKS